MDMTMEEKCELIKKECLKSTSKNPVLLAKTLMALPEISMHGPEHHMLDGSAFLTAYYNAGGAIDLNKALDLLKDRALKMPGAMCGYWGMCGSVASLGAAMSIIHGVGPLSDNDYYKEQMVYTSSVIKKMSTIGGPRCCKRNAFLSLSAATQAINEKEGLSMELPEKIVCEFTSRNPTCLKERCPFYPGKAN